MRAYLALYVLVAALCAVHADCDVCIDGQCYKKHSLSTLNRGACLGMDRNSSTLYLNDNGSVKMCNLATMTCSSTTFTGRYRQVAVDPVTNDVYAIIAMNEIYKLDIANNRKELLLDGPVWRFAFKDKLYFTKGYIGSGIYTFVHGEPRVVPATEIHEAYTFGIDNDGDIYFDNGKVVLRLSKGVVSEVDVQAGCRVSVDRDGNIILIQPNTHVIYRVVNGEVTLVGATKEDTSINFETLFDIDNNLIIRDTHLEYFYVKKETDTHCTTSASGDTRTVTETA